MWASILVGAASLAAAAGAWRCTAPALRPFRRALLALFVALGTQTVRGIYGQDVAAIPAGLDLHDALFWLHHGALLMALGLFAFPYVRAHFALVPVLLVAEPLLRGIEVLILLYLVTVTAWNHHMRANVGSLRVTGGFLLLLVGHALFLAAATPLGERSIWGEGAVLAGIVLLIASLPRSA